MTSNESDSSPGSVPPGPGEPAIASFPETTAGRRDAPPIRVWALALTAGLVAAFASWLIGEAFHDRLRPRLLSTGGIPTVDEARESANGIRAAVALQSSVAFGSLGAALGLALGLAGGAARRSARSGMIGAILGTILGGVAGALTPQVLLPLYFRFYDPDRDDLLLAIVIQGGLGAVVGAVGGASFAIGNRSPVARGLLGGLLGAVGGVVIYEVVGALAFPLDQTTKPISATAGTRLLGRIMVASLAAAGAAKSAGAARIGQGGAKMSAPRTRVG
ncbi:MAG: hypothetical protein P4L85_11010 [Paludisphaera borealis]|uniref:hypothetical protein n=1 Tax=Paludisphaera borealis TaxID=1387353 RepID=UPI00283CBAF3|nr:hypothetical protein [Paludisphaera borealis]MDR3619868.1 hypothetical protein [Paludisphaera borealis]